MNVAPWCYKWDWMDGSSIHPSIHWNFFSVLSNQSAFKLYIVYTQKWINWASSIFGRTDERQSRGAVESKQRVDPIFLLFWGNLYLLAAAAEPISGFVRNTFGHHKSLPPILELDITPKGELLEDKFVSFPPLCRLGSQIASHLFDFNPAGQWNSLVQFFNRSFPS